MKTTTLTPQPGIARLTDAWRFCTMLERFDLSGTIRNEDLLRTLTDLCLKEVQESGGDRYAFVDVHGYPFSKATAVQLGLLLKDKGLIAHPLLRA